MCVKTRLMSAADGACTSGDGPPSPRLPKACVCPPPGLMKAAEFLMHFAASVTLVSPHHSRQCKIKQKQSAALMNRLAQEERVSDVTQDAPLLFSLKFGEPRQTSAAFLQPRSGPTKKQPPPHPLPLLCLNMHFILTFAHDLSCHLHSAGLPFPNFTVIIH